ncbi:MAG: type III-A CRISPR-associated RAMP protein Csm5 [Firmicutes bacterium]|nr:type III-A CRISPR-associated RAMP protein Csm5 [Bacillota bacterium]
MRRTYRIEVLTPVHIFDRRAAPWEAVPDAGRLWVLDEARLARHLARAGLARRWAAAALEPGFRPAAFLRPHGLWPPPAEPVRRVVPAGHLRGQVALALCGGTEDAPYVPGSSVKGNLRTALLYRLLCRDATLRERLEAKLKDTLREARGPRLRELRNKAGQDVDRLLERARLSGAAHPDLHTDWLRAVRVGDAFPDEEAATAVREIGVLSMTGGTDWRLKTPLYVETLPPGSVFRGRLDFDGQLLGWFEGEGEPPFRTVEDLMAALSEFAEAVLNAEIAWYRRAGEPSLAERLESLRDRANLRLGWGGGWEARSTGLAFSEDLRHLVRERFYPPRPGFPFPKSRKAVLEQGRPADVLGWARLELEG